MAIIVFWSGKMWVVVRQDWSWYSWIWSVHWQKSTQSNKLWFLQPLVIKKGRKSSIHRLHFPQSQELWDILLSLSFHPSISPSSCAAHLKALVWRKINSLPSGYLT
jgi:hypothetical protein